MNNTVLILGANGRFGAAAVHAFAEAGWQVLAQARRPLVAVPRALRHAAVRHVAAGINDPVAIVEAARGTQVVVHALNPIYTKWHTEVLPMGRAAMDVARALDATLMLPGNVYNFGADMPALLQETTTQAPTSRKGRLRVALEEAMRQGAATGLHSVVIRAGDFYGGGRGSWMDQVLASKLGSGRLTYPGPVELVHAWAYLPDLARVFVQVAQARSGWRGFESFHFAGHGVTGEQMLAALQASARRLGVLPEAGPVKVGRLPWPLLRIGAPFVPMWRELVEMAYLWTTPHALDGGKLGRLVGAVHNTALDQALDQALLELGFNRSAMEPSLA